jgi:cytochrome P450 family 142 subfamily A polypeptide 1
MSRAHLASGTRPDIDLLDPEFHVGDPHPAYRWMRENEPVYRDRSNRLWAITRMADLREVERRSDVFISGRGYRSIWIPDEQTMISQDDPRHAAQRRLISERFTPRVVARREKEIRELVIACIERFAREGRVELIDALAARLPAILTCRLIGFEDVHWRDLKVWSERLMRVDALYTDIRASNDSALAMADVSQLLAQTLRLRRREPREDLISVWAHAELEGQPMSELGMWNELSLIIPGGAETTRTALAHALMLFCERPADWDALASQPERIPDAIEELLRYITPLNNMFRTAAMDARVGEQEVSAGDRLMLVYPSANRDASVFREPDQLDLCRRPNPHVAFGLGSHFCLGANLARLTLRVALEELTRRFAPPQLLAEPQYEANIFVKAVQRLDLALAAR